MTEEHRYDGAIEAPPGSWSVRCGCGWWARSLITKEHACAAYERHLHDKDWWK